MAVYINRTGAGRGGPVYRPHPIELPYFPKVAEKGMHL
jgi:hypothetical protein